MCCLNCAFVASIVHLLLGYAFVTCCLCVLALLGIKVEIVGFVFPNEAQDGDNVSGEYNLHRFQPMIEVLSHNHHLLATQIEVRP